MILLHTHIVIAVEVALATEKSAVNAVAVRALEIVIVIKDGEAVQEDAVGHVIVTEDDLAVEAAVGPDGQPGTDPTMMEPGRKRERKSRWSVTKSFVPGMPTILPSNLSDDQRTAYL
ncbi:hypothetical protein TELCIR_21925, partial [Teladorsagia circumcincta]